MSAPLDKVSELLHFMHSCMSGFKAWATSSMLKLIDNMTLFMLVTSIRTKYLHNPFTSITIGNSHIPLRQSVKNLGLTFNCHLAMNAQISNIPRIYNLGLRHSAYARRFLTCTATSTLVSAFTLSTIDLCSSLLFGSTHDVTYHLQLMQNYAARVLLRVPKSSNTTTHSKSLNWLPVKVKSTCKMTCLSHHCHNSTAPSYVTDVLQKRPSHTRNTRSSSHAMPHVNRPAHSKAMLGDQSFLACFFFCQELYSKWRLMCRITVII